MYSDELIQIPFRSTISMFALDTSQAVFAIVRPDVAYTKCGAEPGPSANWSTDVLVSCQWASQWQMAQADGTLVAVFYLPEQLNSEVVVLLKFVVVLHQQVAPKDSNLNLVHMFLHASSWLKSGNPVVSKNRRWGAHTVHALCNNWSLSHSALWPNCLWDRNQA